MQGLQESVIRDRGSYLFCGVLMLGLVSVLSGGWASVAQAASLPPSCKTAAAVETEGSRRLALIVGVGKYKSSAVKTLAGAAGDAERIFDLLTGPGGYGFPKTNVCLLLNEEATVAHFKAAFEQHLVNRAKSNDTVVIYFSGHGSIAKDLNGDEGDGNDETLMLHDSRTNGVHDLLDDEFNDMLEQLHHRTQQITVILDSCNSGTAVRGDAVSLTARYMEPETMSGTGPTVSQPGKPEGSQTFTPKDLPGLVLLSAAGDGTSAMETGGRGIFTDALLTVFAQAPKPPLTYAQAVYQVRPLVAARSPQIPDFHGDLSRTVFGNEHRAQAMGFRVSAVAPTLTLSGPPLPGLGVNAEMRVYDGKSLGTDTQNPQKSKATIVIKTSTGLSATAQLVAPGPSSGTIQEGDLAVLVRPGDQFLTLSVRVRPPTQSGGIPVERATAIRNMIQDDPETKAMVVLVHDAKTPALFELSLQDNGKIVLRDAQNQIRNVYEPGGTEPLVIAKNLWQHARQIALKELRGEGGQDFIDQDTLKVSLVPDTEPNQSPCARGATWVQAAPNTLQNVPLCYRYRVKVELAATARAPLLVGGAVLSSDGAILGFADMLNEPLQPGKSRVFTNLFRGQPPLDVEDLVIVFGTQSTSPIQWQLLSSPVDKRATEARGDTRSVTNSLGRALTRYLVPGSRGVGEEQAVLTDTTWTRSSMAMVVRANSGFLAPTQEPKKMSALDKREYTVPNFDIRPYLPNDETTALSRLLRKADSLAKYSNATQDGVRYTQHAWTERTDADNLKTGIDWSRAIWFAFTRAGLPYNKRGDAYVPTVEMTRPDGAMSEQFESCQGAPTELGDILVYRDDQRGDGHTVMVIDPVKRIAWGSHGWDGNVKDGQPPDTGVEYQLIKFKPDWKRWDRTTMDQKACWRYRLIAKEATTSRGIPGTQALGNPCDQQACRISAPPDESFLKTLQEPRP